MPSKLKIKDTNELTFIQRNLHHPRTVVGFGKIVEAMEEKLGLSLIFQAQSPKINHGWYLSKNRSNTWAHTPKRMWIGENAKVGNGLHRYLYHTFRTFSKMPTAPFAPQIGRRRSAIRMFHRFFGPDLFNFLLSRAQD